MALVIVVQGFNLWPGNFCMPQAQHPPPCPGQKKKTDDALKQLNWSSHCGEVETNLGSGVAVPVAMASGNSSNKTPRLGSSRRGAVVNESD